MIPQCDDIRSGIKNCISLLRGNSDNIGIFPVDNTKIYMVIPAKIL